MTTKKLDKTTEKWTKYAKRRLEGRTIKSVRYMYEEEAEGCGWYHRPLVITLDNGALLFPSSDDEGNEAGALFGQSPKGEEETYPVL